MSSARTILFAGLAIVAVLLFAAGPALSQPEHECGGCPHAGEGECPGHAPDMPMPGLDKPPPGLPGPPPHGAGFPPDLLEKMGADLKLNPATLQKVKALVQQAEKQAGEIDAQLTAAFAEQRRLMENDRPDRAAIMTQVEKIGALLTEQTKIRIGMLLSVREMLSPEQRTKLKELMSKRGGPGGPPPLHHPPGPNPKI